MTEQRLTLREFLARRVLPTIPSARPSCAQCWKAASTCYCHMLNPFPAPIEIVILQHPDEARNPIATARMAHLSITNSKLIIGRSFEGDARVDSLLQAPGRRNVMLYPRPDALPLDDVLAASAGPAPAAGPLTLWVIDAKWAQVNKMLRFSPAVSALPATAFVPEKASRFRVRMQPKPACLSTIEAIYTVLDHHAKITGSGVKDHDALLEVFHHLVRQQLGFCDFEADSRHAESQKRRRDRRYAKESASSGSEF